jgi:LacI family transcriptional regulator
VIIDQRRGALAMMNHLVADCGARRIFFVGGLETNIDTQARLQSYRDTLQEAGLKFREGDVYHLDFTYDSAYRLAIEQASDWAGERHCVFAANDEMAAGTVAGAIAKNVCVPLDLGVVGFDDTRVAQMTNPLLTTVRVPMSQMGANAIELLCNRIENPEKEPARVSLEAELVVRNSCRFRRLNE